MFEDRVETFTKHLLEADSFSETTQELALEQLSVFEATDDYLARIGDPHSFSGGLSTLGDKVLDGLRDALAQGSDEGVLSWVKQVSRDITQHFNLLATTGPEDDEASFIATRSRALSQQASTLQDQATLRAATIELNAELQDSAAKAKDAAGIIGAASLATHFGRYADDEERAANMFRVSALVGFAAALSFALIFGNGANSVLTFENEWTALAFKAAGAIGIGGIAAYLARQSGQHRRMANWARSMEVQLQSFPAFIEPLAYEQQAEMYALLARRVLTAPPERSGNTSDDSVGATQLLDVVTALVKRSNTPGT
ncbi:hypothetical protein [Microbacterium hydrocarbonoxydans]|uniref:Uncharacterized protein n=1 Tax=Microbacterium hydrocarbonoxydans TaxID=273678 RepID=A0A1H4IS83_9MICO|nr:hypothetical protein [Microbacterium hydrocarbonoxydans]SEB36082.1 hypothetical protein SAMN04489807_0133 [Microbacterium hydrocarbonoxydans]